jgi:hypothetical protein
MKPQTFPRFARTAAILAAATAVAGTSAVVTTVLTPAAAASAAPSATPSATASATAGAHGHVTVLRFAVKFSDHYLVDVPPSNPDGVGLGDYAVFSDQLLDGKGHVVGTEGGSGLVTNITEGQIFFTLAIQLPHGQIAASGLSSAAPSKELAVTGGTGRYVGVGGRLNLVENGNGTGTLVLTLRA